MSEVQAYRFPKASWTKQQASSWLANHNLAPILWTTSPHQHRARMRPPKSFKRFVTLKAFANGSKPFEMIIGFRKNK